MAKKKENNINHLETFYFSDIPTQPYPVYSISESGNLYSLKNIVYPGKSAKKFTRAKQLKWKSQQARLVDFLINIDYFYPLTVYREFLVPIQNSLRLPGISGGFFLLDFYFYELSLALELDSDYHNLDADNLRDEYLEQLGIEVFRIYNLEKITTQKGKFKEFIALLKSKVPVQNPRPFDFLGDLRKREQGGDSSGLWKID